MKKCFKVAAVQAAPVFMDLQKGIEKTVELIEQAAKQKASLIAFPECWLPGYPWWIWLNAPINNLKYIQRYHENSLVFESEEFAIICKAALDNDIFVSLGASEREHGSLYIAQFLIGNDGTVLQARRKLKPTHVERTLFGEGDGSDIEVTETTLGRIGQLSCWEHLQPLIKYAVYSQHEQLHIAAWPSFSCYPQAYSLGPELNNAVSQVYAAEGQCFVLAPCAVVSPQMIELLVENDEHRELLTCGGGHARIFSPDGSPMCEKLAEDEEGLLFAEIDLGMISVAKSFADPVGHYSRPDVTRLWFNPSPQPKVCEFELNDESICEGNDIQET